MGCGGSSTSPNSSPSAPAKDEPVVAFQTDVEDDDDIESITPAPSSKLPDGRNPKSAMAFAHNATPEETQAAIERSLTLKATPSSTFGSPGDSRFRDDVIQLIDEPVPFNVEQSPRSSPRMQKSFSNPDRSSPPARAKHTFEESDNYEKKHYFPDSSPTWDVKGDEKDRSPVWSSSAPADKPPVSGAKRDPLFPSIAVRPQPTLARASSDADVNNAHLPSIYGSDGKPEPVQLAIVALEQKKMREEHEKNMGSLAYIENYRNSTQKTTASMLD